ncbi:MAG: YdcF family protein [Oscillospiraceae bacterium]|jgi:vancomycin permeability regulator SanA|nr:YdcF family protein [Oscillospiraceae bacterium]
MPKNSSKALNAVMISRSERHRRRKRVRVLVLSLCVVLCAGIVVGGLNYYLVQTTRPHILAAEESAALQSQGYDCILVLGAKVETDGTPSHMLEDRVRRGVELYNAKAAPVLLMSGDHGQVNYDEVRSMKQYAVNAGVPSADVFMDHAGFSTYDSLYRARDVFGAKKVLIVTQRYHLHRALYIARQLGLEAQGVPCDYRTYGTWLFNESRESLARLKALVMCALRSKPVFLGDPISLALSGDVTNDPGVVFAPAVR